MELRAAAARAAPPGFAASFAASFAVSFDGSLFAVNVEDGLAALIPLAAFAAFAALNWASSSARERFEEALMFEVQKLWSC